MASSSVAVQNVWRKIPMSSKSWTPPVKEGYAAVHVQGKIYIIGGVGGGGTRYTGSSSYPADASQPAPSLQPGAVQGFLRGTASAVTATDSFSHVNSVFAYDVAAAEWSIASTSGTPPPPRSNLAAVAVGHCIVVHGGQGPQPTAPGAASASNAAPQARSVSVAGHAPAGALDQGAHSLASAMDEGKPPMELFSDLHVLDTRSMRWTTAQPNAVIADFSEELLTSSVAAGAPDSPEHAAAAPQPDEPQDAPQGSLFASLLSDGKAPSHLDERLSPSQRAQTAADMRDRHRLVQLVAALAAPVFVAGTMNALRQHFGAAAPVSYGASQTDVRDLLDKMVKSREVATAASRRPHAAAAQRATARKSADAKGGRGRSSPRPTVDARSDATSAVSGGLGHDHPYRHTPLKRVRGALLLLPDLVVDAAMQEAPVPTPRLAAPSGDAAASFAQVDIGVPVPPAAVHAIAGDSSLMMQLCNQLSSALSPLAAVPEPRHSHSLCTWATDGGAAPALVMFGGMTRTAALSSATFTAGVSSSNKRRTMEVPSTDVFLFDVNAGVWIKLPIEGPSAPAARGYHAASIVGNRMYVYGGLGADGVLGDMWELDLTPLAHLTSIAGSVVQARVNDVAEHVLGMHGLSSQRGAASAQRRGAGDKLGNTRMLNANISDKLPACRWRCLANAPGPAELAMHARHKRVNALRAGRDEEAEAAAVAEEQLAAVTKSGNLGQHSVVSSAATVAWNTNWGPGAVFGHRMVPDPWDDCSLLVSGGRSWFGAPTSGAAGAARSTALGAMQVWKFNVGRLAWEPVSAPGENRTASAADVSGSVVGAVLQAQAFHEQGGTQPAAAEPSIDEDASAVQSSMPPIAEGNEQKEGASLGGESDDSKQGDAAAEAEEAGVVEQKDGFEGEAKRSDDAPGDTSLAQSSNSTSTPRGQPAAVAPAGQTVAKAARTGTPGGFSIADSATTAPGAAAAGFRASSGDTADLPPPLFRFCMMSLWVTASEEGIFKQWAQHRSVVFGARAAVGMRITSLAAVSVAPAPGASRSLVSALGWRAATGGTPKPRGSAALGSPAGGFEAFGAVVDAVAVPSAVSKAGAERSQARKRALHALLPALAPLVMAAHRRSDAWNNAEDTAWVNGVLSRLAAALDAKAWWFSGHGFRVELVGKGWFKVPPAGYAGPFSPRGDLGKRVRTVPLRHLGGRGLALAAAHEIAQRQVFTAGGTRQGHLSAVGVRDADTAQPGRRRISTAGAARAVMASLSARSIGAAAAADRAAGRPSAKAEDEHKSEHQAGEGASITPQPRDQLAAASAASLLDSAQAEHDAWVASPEDFDVSVAEARSVPGGTLRRLFDPSPEERVQLMTEALYRRVVVFGGICVPPPAPHSSGEHGVDTARSRSIPSRASVGPAREATSSMGTASSLYELGTALEGALARRPDEEYDAWFARVNNDARLSEIWRHRQAVAEQRSSLRKRGRGVAGEPVSADTAAKLAAASAHGRLSSAGFLPLTDMFQLCLAPPDLCAQPDESGAEDAAEQPGTQASNKHMVQFDRTATDHSDAVHAGRAGSPAGSRHSTVSHRDGDGPSALLVARSRRTQDITDVRKPGQLGSLVPPDPNAFKPHEAPPKKATRASPEQAAANGAHATAARKRLPSASLPDTATNKTLVQVLVNEVEGGAGNTRTTGRGTEFPSSEPLLMPSTTTNTLAKLMSRDARADAATAAHVDAILPKQMQRKFPTGLKLDGPVPEETLLAAAKVAQRAERGASREALAALLGVRTAAVMDPRVNSAAPVLAAEAAMVGPLITFDAREIALRSQADRPAQRNMSMSMTNLGSGAQGVEASKASGEALVPIADDGDAEGRSGRVRMQAGGDSSERKSRSGLVSPMRVPAGFVIASGRTGVNAGTTASGAKKSFVRVPSRKASRARVPGSPGTAASSDAGLGGSGHFPVDAMQGEDGTADATPREDAAADSDFLRDAPVYTIRAAYDDDAEDGILPPTSTYLADIASGVVSAVDAVPGWQKQQKAADIVDAKQRAESRASSRRGRRFETSAATQDVDVASPPAAPRPLAVSPPDKHRAKPSRVLHPALVHSMKASVQREQTREHIRTVLGQRETGTASTTALARSALGAGNTASMSSIVSGAPGVTQQVADVGGAVTETVELNPGGMARSHPKAEGDVDGGASAAVSPRFTMAGSSALMHVGKYAGDMQAFGGRSDEGKANAGVPVSHRPTPNAVPEGQQSDVNAAARRGIGGSIPYSQPPRQRAGGQGMDSQRAGPQRWLSAAEVVVSRRSKRTQPSVSAAAAAAAGDGIVDSHATVIGEGHRAGRKAQGRVAGDLRGFVTPRSAASNDMLRQGSASGVGRSLRARGTGGNAKSLLHVHKQAERLLHQHAHVAQKRSAGHGSSDGVMDDVTASELSKYGMITLQDQMNSRMVPSKDKNGKSASSQRQATQEAIQLALSTAKEFSAVKRGGAPASTINADSDAARAVQLAKALAGNDTGAGLRGAADDDSDSDDEPLGKHRMPASSGKPGASAPHAPTATLHESASVKSMGAAGTIAPGFASTLSTHGRTAVGMGKSSSTRLTTTAPMRSWGAAAPAAAPHSDLTGHKLQVHGVTRPAQLKALSLSQQKHKKRTAGDPNQAITAGSSSASSAFVQKQPILSAFDHATPKPNLTALRRQMQAEFAKQHK